LSRDYFTTMTKQFFKKKKISSFWTLFFCFTLRNEVFTPQLNYCCRSAYSFCGMDFFSLLFVRFESYQHDCLIVQVSHESAAPNRVYGMTREFIHLAEQGIWFISFCSAKYVSFLFISILFFFSICNVYVSQEGIMHSQLESN